MSVFISCLYSVSVLKSFFSLKNVMSKFLDDPGAF